MVQGPYQTPPVEEISIREYARRRGKSHVKVLRDIARGLIQKTASGKIDPVAADAAWEKNREPSQESKPVPGAKPGRADRPSVAAAKAPIQKAEDSEEAEEEARSYAKAREMREYVKLERDELDLGKFKGQFVSSDDVALQARTTAHLIREGMLAIPDRVSSLAAAESDSSRVHAMLSKEIRKVLTALADGIEPVIQ